jgi:histone H3/H4
VPEASREEAAAGFRRKSGRGAVDASGALKGLKEARNLESDDDERLDKEALRRLMRRIGSKTFYFDAESEMWIDAQAKVDAPRKKVKYLSDEYFELLTKHPEIGRYLSLGSRVLVTYSGTVFEIVER